MSIKNRIIETLAVFGLVVSFVQAGIVATKSFYSAMFLVLIGMVCLELFARVYGGRISKEIKEGILVTFPGEKVKGQWDK